MPLGDCKTFWYRTTTRYHKRYESYLQDSMMQDIWCDNHEFQQRSIKHYICKRISRSDVENHLSVLHHGIESNLRNHEDPHRNFNKAPKSPLKFFIASSIYRGLTFTMKSLSNPSPCKSIRLGDTFWEVTNSIGLSSLECLQKQYPQLVLTSQG